MHFMNCNFRTKTCNLRNMRKFTSQKLYKLLINYVICIEFIYHITSFTYHIILFIYNNYHLLLNNN